MSIRHGVSKKNPFLSHMLPLYPIDSVLCLTEVFSFVRSQLLVVDLRAIGICPESYLLCQKSLRLFPTFSSLKFSEFGFMLRSLFHLAYSFMEHAEYISICILLHATTQFNQHHCLKVLSCSRHIFLASLSKLRHP